MTDESADKGYIYKTPLTRKQLEEGLETPLVHYPAVDAKRAEQELIEELRQKGFVSDSVFEENEGRFGFHKGTEVTIPLHQEVRALYLELANRLSTILPEGRAKAMAMTELEASAMWANKAVANLAPVIDED